MICPACKTKNQYYHRYCYYCGYKLDNPKTILKNQKSQKTQDPVQTENDFLFEQVKNIENNDVKETTSNLENNSENEFLYNKNTKENENEENENTDNNYIESISGSQQSLYDYLFSDNNTSNFDITREIPLRRYRKGRSSRKTNRGVKSFISIISVALLVFIIFVLFKEIGNNIPKQVNNSKAIVVSTVVKSIQQDGEPAHQIIFNTTNGKEVKILDTTIPVEDGRAELVLKDSYLYTLNPVQNEDGFLEVKLDSIISAPGFEDVNETVSIVLNQPYALLNLIQPSSGEAIVEGDSFQLVLSVEPGSRVFINDNEYTDLVAEDGKFVKEIDIPPENDETYVTIKVSHEGFMDNIQEIVLKKPVMEVPISINETSPIPSDGQWVKVSGTTLPGAALNANRETREDSIIDMETGEFVLYIKASYPGYTPCILTSELDGKVSSIEIILDGETNVDKYTSTAWKPEYDNMRRIPDLHNGRHFLFKGIVEDILTTGYKNVFIVNTSTDSNSEKLIHVEYWENDFNFNEGDNIRVFGNRWGNINDMPRILAKYIYNY